MVCRVRIKVTARQERDVQCVPDDRNVGRKESNNGRLMKRPRKRLLLRDSDGRNVSVQSSKLLLFGAIAEDVLVPAIYWPLND